MGDKVERSGEAWRVQRFEGISLDEFKARLQNGEGKKEVLEYLDDTLLQSDPGGNPDKIDAGYETEMLAKKLLKYSGLLQHTIISEDVKAYTQQYNQKLWEEKRSGLRAELHLDRVHHPFALIPSVMPVQYFSSFRSLPVFNGLADILPEKLPDVAKKRNLNVLYPGSGDHIAPLMTAIALIDRGIIDRATFVYTEVDEDSVLLLWDIFKTGVEGGIFDFVRVNARVDFPDAGSERSIDIVYRGKPIHLLFAAKRSGDAYYRPEYLQNADLVVIHDPGHGWITDSYDLLGQMLLDKSKNFPDKSQLMIMEGEPLLGETHFPITPTVVPGDYGHCSGGADYVGELGDCSYTSAHVFLMNEPALIELTKKYPTAAEISDAIYPHNQEMKVYVAPGMSGE